MKRIIFLFALVSCFALFSFTPKEQGFSSELSTTPPAMIYNDIADGPSYMGSNSFVKWQYTGSMDNVSSISWWYRKIGGQASYVIGYGHEVFLTAIPDTYYSNESHRTSDFIIYIQVNYTNGSTVTSREYDVMKKGMWKLTAVSLE